MTAAVNVKQKPYPVALASTSPYRAKLLAWTGIRFDQAAPDYDEESMYVMSEFRTSEGNVTDARALACRHAVGKAAALTDLHPSPHLSPHAGSLIIGSDQTGICQNKLLQKPGTHEAAARQLALCSGQEAIFYTAMALLIPVQDNLQARLIDKEKHDAGHTAAWLGELRTSLADSHTLEVITVATALQFRCLEAEEIERYLRLDQPYDCAGSFKLEAHGACLFEYCRSDDPSAIIGLPLMALSKRLIELGYQLYAA